MVNEAGKYRERFVLLERDVTQEATLGQNEPAFVETDVVLWGYEEALNATEVTHMAVMESQVNVKLNFRNRLLWLNPKDRLKWKATGYVYEVQGVAIAINATTVYAYRSPVLKNQLMKDA